MARLEILFYFMGRFKFVRTWECKCCINNGLNKSVTVNKDGLCNICSDYKANFDRKLLQGELIFLKNFISNKGDYDCMVGLSGGKDSTAMLDSVLELGFHPLTFSLQAYYNNLTISVTDRIKLITKKFNVDYHVIDAITYLSDVDRQCFEKMADIYEKAVAGEISPEKFRNLYFKGREFYSTKKDVIFPFVRPCQICRKIAIRAYYAEAVKRKIKIVFVGINEWASGKLGKYSAIRCLKPYENAPEVFIVHLPYLLQRKYSDVMKILEDMSCKELVIDMDVKTGGNSCLLARACEKVAFDMLGFHLDSARLAREVTVGFIDKQTAQKAIENGKYDSERTVREVLTDCHII